uniref:Uncharacterized protein n=1 Tax=Rhizophora mucronata TaxID=61149 RepID=A0A2P2Q6K5_RHIMU
MEWEVPQSTVCVSLLKHAVLTNCDKKIKNVSKQDQYPSKTIKLKKYTWHDAVPPRHALPQSF